MSRTRRTPIDSNELVDLSGLGRAAAGSASVADRLRGRRSERCGPMTVSQVMTGESYVALGSGEEVAVRGRWCEIPHLEVGDQ